MVVEMMSRGRGVEPARGSVRAPTGGQPGRGDVVETSPGLRRVVLGWELSRGVVSCLV